MAVVNKKAHKAALAASNAAKAQAVVGAAPAVPAPAVPAPAVPAPAVLTGTLQQQAQQAGVIAATAASKAHGGQGKVAAPSATGIAAAHAGLATRGIANNAAAHATAGSIYWGANPSTSAPERGFNLGRSQLTLVGALAYYAQQPQALAAALAHVQTYCPAAMQAAAGLIAAQTPTAPSAS